MKKLYAQQDGDEIDGKRYKIGAEIDADTNPGVLAVLQARGLIAETKPSGINEAPVENEIGLPIDSDPSTIKARVLAETDPADMTREELVAHFAELQTGNATDEQLRDFISRTREQSGDDDDDDDLGDGKTGEAEKLPEVKSSMPKADLEKIAADEGVTFGPDVTNNDHRVEAIEKARAEKADAA